MDHKRKRSLLRLLCELKDQLEAMNVSASHACSWIEPRTNETTRKIKRLDRAIKALSAE